MNKTFTRNFATAVIMVIATWMVPLLAQSEEQIEQFKKEREAYFTERLELTESESDAFWCVYDDFFNRKMKLAEDERNAFSYAHKNAENLSDEEITEILDKIRNLKVEQLKLENEYYQDKFTKVLPPKKVLKLYKVEWDFRRHLLRKLRNQGKERGDRGNRGGGTPTDKEGPMVLLPEHPLGFNH